MRETLAEWRVVFTEEMRRGVKRRAFLLMALSVPVLAVVILGAITVIRAALDRADEGPTDIGVVDLSPDVELALGAPSGVIFYATREAGIVAFDKDETGRELFVVPVDYLESGSVEWIHKSGAVFSGFDPGPGRAPAAMVTALLRLALARDGVPTEGLTRALVPTIFELVRIGEDLQPASQARFVVALIAALILMMAIMVGSSSLVTAVAEEKQNRMIETLLTSTRPLALLAGKLVAVGLTILMVVGIWLASLAVLLPLVFDSIPAAHDIPVDLRAFPWVVAFFLAGYLVSGVVMAGIGAVANGVREATQLSAVVIFPLVIPVYGIAIIVPNLDGAFARLQSFIPFTAPTTMMIRLAVGEPPMGEVVASLLVMLLTAGALLWVSARAFRTGLLSAGGGSGMRRLTLLVRRSVCGSCSGTVRRLDDRC